MAAIDTIRETLFEKGLRLGENLDWHGLKFFWADQPYPGTETVFAKYLLLPLSFREWKTFKESDEQFFAEVVEETYYQLHNDLCWNLYLVCILPDADFAQIDQHIRFDFERNPNFTRNLVLKESELRARLPVGHTLLQESDRPTAQPEQEWRDTLKGYEFCMETFNDKRFQAIGSAPPETLSDKTSQPIAFEAPAHTAAGAASAPSQAEKIHAVHCAHIPQGFRPHFYTRDLDFTFPQVTLLSGANGSGKTSVLSAIELAMTGSVRKQHRTPGDRADQADVSLKLRTAAATKEIHKPESAKDKKNRETLWYNNRAENRTAEQLNVSFHRFNCFSVDDTYLFASEQPNHGDIFSKLLYGPETTAKWKNILNWKEKCSQIIAKYHADITHLKGFLNQPSPVKAVDEQGLRSYIQRSGLNIAPNATYKQITEIVTAIQAALNQMSAYHPILSREALMDAKQKTEQQLADARADAFALQEQSRKYSDDFEKRKRDMERDESCLTRIRQREKDLSPLEKWLPVLELEAPHHISFRMLREMQQELDEFDNRYAGLQGFWDQYRELLDCTALPDLDVQRDEFEKRAEAFDARSKEVNVRISKAEMHVELGKKLLDQLRETGRQLAREQPAMHQCPLCGTENITAEAILRHLDEEPEASSADLSQLYQERQNLKKEQLLLNRQRETLNQMRKTADTIEAAYHSAKKQFPELAAGGPLEAVKRVLEKRQRLENQRSQRQSAFLEQKRRIQKWYSSECGTPSFEKLLTIEENVRALLLRSNYPECETLSGIPLLERAQEILRKLRSDRAEMERSLSEQKTALDAGPLHGLEEQQKKLHDQLLVLERDAKRWNQLNRFWETVSEWVHSEAVDLDGAALQAHCEKLLKDVKNITEYAACQQEHEKYASRKTQLEQECECYEKVLTRLDKARALESYSQEFIRQNIGQISQIFLSLHLPQEFSGLEMEDGELIGLRGEERVPVVNMSTGQRTALVLSVFFQLHLSNSAAPGFLLIDEPVANIDDLNVLSLMDFLRELVVTHGRQIFFTTASRNVAQLFRRKFSFLGEGFQRLDFSRESTDTLKITQTTYNQSGVAKQPERLV